MKVAVTGANGYVGRHVLAALGAFPDVRPVACVRHRDRALGLPAELPLVELDMSAPENAFERMGRPDMLVHLAWGGLPNYTSLHHFAEELPRQFAFLRALIEQGLKSVLVTGTCYEYGMRNGELSEEMEAPATNPYGFAKAALRHQLRFLQQQTPFSLTWARLFYSWGAGQAPSSLYSLLHAALDRGDARFPMSRGEQLRDFLPAPEMARLIAQLARLAPDTDVNVCSGEPVSVRALVERWCAEAGRGIELELGVYPYPRHEPLAFWGSRRKLDQLLSGTG